MRTEIGVHPWAKYFQPYLNGEKLEHCRMADEELGCAEVYETYEHEGRTLRRTQTRMVFGHIEDRPTNELTQRIKDNPDQAQAIWDEYYAALQADWAREEQWARVEQ